MYPPYEGLQAREIISGAVYEIDGTGLTVPLGFDPLREVGTRIIVPFLDEKVVDAIKSGELADWLERCWWRAIQLGIVDIQIVDEIERPSEPQYVEWPDWWAGEPWKTEIAKSGVIHEIHEGCKLQLFENEKYKKVGVKRLVLLYDEHLEANEIVEEYPEYSGIQLLRGYQWIETRGSEVFYEFIPKDKQSGFRAFIEFDEDTDKLLRHEDVEKPSHTAFHWNKSPLTTIKKYLIEKLEIFAKEMGWIEGQGESGTETSRHHLQTNQFVFDTLLNTSIGNIPIDEDGSETGEESDKPWDVDVLLIYPNAHVKSSRVNWGETIRNIRFVVNSAPENVRRNTRYALEWIEPNGKPMAIWSKDRINRADQEFRVGDRRLVKQAINDRDIVCTKPGIYRIRAVVYEGKKLVAKKALRIHLEMDRPIPPEKPYTVSISVENQTSPGELRIQSGDILNLQINGRNRTFDPVSADLFVRMREGSTVLPDKAVHMSAKRLGQDDRRRKLHWQQLRIVHPGSNDLANDDGIQTLTLDSGQHVMQAHLLNGSEELAYGSYTLHFESEPGRMQGNIPFEPKEIREEKSPPMWFPPMWDLRMDESKICFPKEYPLLAELPQPTENTSPFEKQNAFTLEISINGILEWALDPLYEKDPTNLEALKAAKPDLIDDAVWDEYIERLSVLASMVEQSIDKQPPSLLDFAKQWRRTVASVYPVLRSAR